MIEFIVYCICVFIGIISLIFIGAVSVLFVVISLYFNWELITQSFFKWNHYDDKE